MHDKTFEEIIRLIEIEKITALTLRNQDISLPQLEALANIIIHEDSKLEFLNLCDCGLEDPAIDIIAAMISNNHTLLGINLCMNSIGVLGAQALSHALKTNQTLEFIDLHENFIEEAGAEAFASMLEINQTLQVANLGANNIREGGMALARALEINQTLHTLSLSDNDLFDSRAAPNVISVLASALLKNETLQRLDLTSNEMMDEDVKCLARALLKNETLTMLLLRDNLIGDAGALALAGSLFKNHTLQTFDLSYNQIGLIGTSAFARLLLHQLLGELYFSENDIDFLFTMTCRIKSFYQFYKGLDNLDQEDLDPMVINEMRRHIQVFVLDTHAQSYQDKASAVEKSAKNIARNLDFLCSKIKRKNGQSLADVNRALYDSNVTRIIGECIPECRKINVFLSLFKMRQKNMNGHDAPERDQADEQHSKRRKLD